MVNVTIYIIHGSYGNVDDFNTTMMIIKYLSMLIPIGGGAESAYRYTHTNCSSKSSQPLGDTISICVIDH